MVQDIKKIEFSTKFDALLFRSCITKEIFDNNLVQLKILNG